MANELRRAPRYSVTAVAKITDLNSGAQITAQTSDMSLVGCYVDTLNPLPAETAVKISITHGDETFASAGLVVYCKASMGMGIKFLKVPHAHLDILKGWFSESDQNRS